MPGSGLCGFGPVCLGIQWGVSPCAFVASESNPIKPHHAIGWVFLCFLCFWWWGVCGGFPPKKLPEKADRGTTRNWPAKHQNARRAPARIGRVVATGIHTAPHLNFEAVRGRMVSPHPTPGMASPWPGGPETHCKAYFIEYVRTRPDEVRPTT